MDPASRMNIKRPPNGYILFCKEWRRRLATQYATEKSSEISIRLGKMWHALTSVEEQKYLNLGRLTAQEHGQRHPDYSYNPIEAQRQKAAHVGAHRVKGMNPKGHKVTNTLGVSGKGACSRPSPASSRVSNFTPYTVKLLQITALIQ
ncbi:transcription factor SOX-8 isoform X2 [Cryptotermes secundus]|nr:transcription factor SOX-8 isoform X2 [Cryptotermes secundus]